MKQIWVQGITLEKKVRIARFSRGLFYLPYLPSEDRKVACYLKGIADGADIREGKKKGIEE